MSGLAALTANYTDSEDEDVNKAEEEDENTRDSLAGGASNPPSNLIKSATATPNSQTSAKSTPTKQKLLNLVSYGDIQDDNDDKDAEPVPMELESDEEQPAANKEELREDSILNRSGSVIEVDAWTEGGKLPPEPTGLCSPRIQESVNKAMKKKLDYGYDMNAVIQRKKAFRNPSIYEKLIQFCEIDEHGTNFPKDLYDGHLFGKESYYDELSKVQMLDMERREKAAKERNAKMAKEGNHDSAPKRKSKWDQGPSAQGSSASKTIPAFGALKK